jgi:hypothetical protein
VSLIYGAASIDEVTSEPHGVTSFAIMLKNQEVVFSTRSFIPEQAIGVGKGYLWVYRMTPQIWINPDGFTLAWPIFGAEDDYQFRTISRDGTDKLFPPVSLPIDREVDTLNTCIYDAQLETLRLPASNDLWVEINNSGNFIEIDPAESDTSSQVNYYQFFYGRVYDYDYYGGVWEIFLQRYYSFIDQHFTMDPNHLEFRCYGTFLTVVYNPTNIRYL